MDEVVQDFWKATIINTLFTLMLFMREVFNKPSDYILIGIGIATSFMIYAQIADKAMKVKK